jgi:hypothetical protein
MRVFRHALLFDRKKENIPPETLPPRFAATA